MLLCCYLEIKFICAHIGIILMIKTGLKIVFLYRAMIVVWFWWHFILSFAVFFLRISSCITPQLRSKFIRQLTMIACAAKFFFCSFVYLLYFFGGKIWKFALNTVEIHEKGEQSYFFKGRRERWKNDTFWS